MQSVNCATRRRNSGPNGAFPGIHALDARESPKDPLGGHRGLCEGLALGPSRIREPNIPAVPRFYGIADPEVPCAVSRSAISCLTDPAVFLSRGIPFFLHITGITLAEEKEKDESTQTPEEGKEKITDISNDEKDDFRGLFDKVLGGDDLCVTVIALIQSKRPARLQHLPPLRLNSTRGLLPLPLRLFFNELALHCSRLKELKMIGMCMIPEWLAILAQSAGLRNSLRKLTFDRHDPYSLPDVPELPRLQLFQESVNIIPSYSLSPPPPKTNNYPIR